MGVGGYFCDSDASSSCNGYDGAYDCWGVVMVVVALVLDMVMLMVCTMAMTVLGMVMVAVWVVAFGL